MTYEERRALENHMNALFGGMWHTATWLCRENNEPEVCYWCKAPVTHLADVNIWGNVCRTPACEACYKKNHGRCRDEL